MTVEEILARGAYENGERNETTAFGVPWGHPDISNVMEHFIDHQKAALKTLTDAGYAVVPVEPTEAMLDVFHDQIRIEALPHKKQCCILNDKYIYKAMIETGAHKV